MLEINYYHLIILVLLAIVFQSSFSQRRITSGYDVTADNKFMVYFVKADTSPTKYVGWTCGGVIISDEYILTSAACVQDVQHMYVIAGYKKYVSAERMEDDECVRERKKKVILTCVPRSYQLDYNRTEIWSKEDIAVVKVDTPFDFSDTTYEQVCSYTPKSIEFNIEKSFPKVGDDAIVLGWGHTAMYRKDEDRFDYNSEILKFASVKVMDENECVKYYSENKKIAELIRQSMLCTLEGGNLNDRGELIIRTQPGAGCVSEKENLMGQTGKICEENVLVPSEFYAEETDGDIVDVGEIQYEQADIESFVVNDARRQMEEADLPAEETPNMPDGEGEIIPASEIEEKPETGGITYPEDDGKEVTTESTKNDESLNDYEDRPGICQNDHGGPLITWRGGKVVVVAVATLFKQDKQRHCRGPFLYTKTWCNGVFLNCILDQGKNNTSSRRNCDDPKAVGFEIIRRHISWVGHRDGPAENERIQMRHQVPISAYHP